MKSTSHLSKNKMPKAKPNRLWLARKRLGYEQKQIAPLLGHRAVSQISFWESGHRVPNLKTALKFSILYRLPVRVLFHTYYERCREELISLAKQDGREYGFNVDLTEPTDYCSYIELMRSPFVTEIDKVKIRRHIKQLMDERSAKILDN